MKTLRPWRRRVPLLPRIGWFELAALLLCAWGAGLVLAAIELGHWRRELTQTLVQLNADARFRARVPHRDAVDPAWYQRKALALLSATQRLHRDASWTLVVPGSWRRFDDLEERVQARLAQEFDEIVVETIRRQLLARAARLTGVPQLYRADARTATWECQAPAPDVGTQPPSAAPEDLPEFLAVARYARELEELDRAVQAYLSLQHAGGQPEHLRQLVGYTLGAELPGRLANAVRMFRGPEANIAPELLQSRLQWAARCSLAKGMAALHRRLLATNELLALERALAERSAGLFEPGARLAGPDHLPGRYRAVHAVLKDQHHLLARGRNAWMRQASLQLGPAYQEVLDRIARTRLLGPDMVRRLHDESGAAFAEFRRQFESAFGRSGAPGIVWLEQEGRFGLAPDRAALREGLAGLLQASFMQEEAAAVSRSPVPLGVVAQEARQLAEARKQFLATGLPAFPARVQPAVAQAVDQRVSALVFERAQRALQASLPADTATPLDPVLLRQQREQVAVLQAVLRESGAAALGQRLAATLDAGLARRLAALHEDWRRQPLLETQASDFRAWHGEPLVAAHAIGAPDPLAVPGAIARAATRLDLYAQQAGSLLALGSPTLARDPAAQKWHQLQAELERYRARSAASNLLRMASYLGALGVDLRGDNCAERLGGALTQPVHHDEIAERLAAIHNALARRCNELRAPVAGSVTAP